MRIKVINESINELPKYETENSAGMDVRANLKSAITIEPGERALIDTGLKVEIPSGYEIQLRPRSGLSIKYGVTINNSPGTIDADFRGSCGVILINHGTSSFLVNPGDRVGQFVLNKCEKIEWEVSETLSETERSEGGFGSTGQK